MENYLLDPNDPNNPLTQYLMGKANDPSAGLLQKYPQLAMAPQSPAPSPTTALMGDLTSGITNYQNTPTIAPPAPPPLAPMQLDATAPAPVAPKPDAAAAPADHGEGPSTSGAPQDLPDLASNAPAPAAQAAPATPTGPQSVNDIVGPDYSDDARKALYDRINKATPGQIISDTLSGLGDSIARSYGGQNTDYLKGTLGTQDKLKQRALDQFKEGRGQMIQDYTLGRQLVENQRKDQAYKLDQRQIKDAQDPNSAISIGARRAAELLDPKGAANGTYQGKSAFDLNPSLPALEKAGEVEATRNRYGREDAMRVDLKAQSAAESMNKDLDPSSWSSRSAGGQSASRLAAGQRAMQLIEQGKTQPGGLTQSQTQELATSVNALVSGGTSGAAREIDALVPHTLMGKTRSFEQYITSEPKGLQQPEFTQQLADTVRRETSLADSQVKTAQAQRLGGHQWLAKNAPDLYQASLQRTGLDPAQLDEKGNYKGAPTFRGQSTTATDQTEPTVSKTINGVTYVRHNGQWYQQ